MEEAQWERNGITVSKAKKMEDPLIKDIIARYPDELSQSDIHYSQFLVARHESEVIGFVRLREREGKLLECASLWVDEPYRGQHLAQFLSRALLRSVKKGKVYIRLFASMEQYYATLGFRHVLKPPAIFQEWLTKVQEEDPEHRPRLVMVYDTAQNKADTSLAAIPDLLVIDGGKGQLSTVHEVLKQFDIQIPVIGLAKREEEVFVPGKSDPIIFPADSQAKFMLMRLRDEAHRFANNHRKKRISKHAFESQLDRVPGLGEEGKKKLLLKFGDIDSIRRQSDEALLKVISEEQVAGLRQIL